MKVFFFKYCVLLCLFLTVVIPNSLQEIAFLSLFITTLISISIGFRRFPTKLLTIIAASIVVTLFYLAFGIFKGAPSNAIYQVPIVYIASPIMWIIIFYQFMILFKNELILKYFKIMTMLALLSIVIFFFLFIQFGPNAVAFFIAQSNVDIREGVVAATMHVYGSLVFLTGASFAAPSVYKTKVWRVLCILFLTIAALTSGRAALIMAPGIGGLIFLSSIKVQSVRLENIMFFAVGGVVFLYGIGLLSSYLGINLEGTLVNFIERFSKLGEGVRDDQFYALLDGIDQTYALGAGHGIGVDYIRSYEFPWRYELIWIATIYRVGLVGSVIYALPFLLYIIWSFKRVIRGNSTEFERYLFGGFLASFVASATNPYLEAFSFQWMFIIPIIFMYTQKQNTSNKRTNI